jgi:cbb3-type cytochrome oxidase subunit 3
MFDLLKENLPVLQYAHLLWGAALFAGLIIWIYWPSRRGSMQDHGRSILEEDRKS